MIFFLESYLVPLEVIFSFVRHEHQVIISSFTDHLYKRFLLKPDQPPDAKLLRVAIIGAPNSGKSTLINKLMSWKVSFL